MSTAKIPTKNEKDASEIKYTVYMSKDREEPKYTDKTE